MSRHSAHVYDPYQSDLHLIKSEVDTSLVVRYCRNRTHVFAPMGLREENCMNFIFLVTTTKVRDWNSIFCLSWEMFNWGPECYFWSYVYGLPCAFPFCRSYEMRWMVFLCACVKFKFTIRFNIKWERWIMKLVLFFLFIYCVSRDNYINEAQDKCTIVALDT